MSGDCNNNEKTRPPTCILVLGMHRSGTSALTGVLNILDVYLGSELLKPTSNNPKGFYENTKLYQLNERLLEEVGSSWDDTFYKSQQLENSQLEQELVNALESEFGGRTLFAIKDPRLAYLFPIYERALEKMGVQIKVVIPLRNPLEVAESLRARNKFSQEKALLLWAMHFLFSEKATRKIPRVFIAFDNFITSTFDTIKVIDEHLQLELCSKFKEKHNEIEAFLTPGLKHHNLDDTELNKNAYKLIKNIYALALGANQLEDTTGFDELANEFFSQRDLFYNSDIRHKYCGSEWQETIKNNSVNLPHKEKELSGLKKEFKSLCDEKQLLQNQVHESAKLITHKNELIASLRLKLYAAHTEKNALSIKAYIKNIYLFNLLRKIVRFYKREGVKGVTVRLSSKLQELTDKLPVPNIVWRNKRNNQSLRLLATNQAENTSDSTIYLNNSKLQTRSDKGAIPLSKGITLHDKSVVRRICLFAGYDSDGIVDDYVIELIGELAQYCDVYYLADSHMLPGELDKLSGLVKQAWAFRHEEYDFGSYSRLARDLVGWDAIREYDELLLVNDSGYLLRSLKPLFEKMDKTSCDWWGLQATKGIYATRNVKSNRFKEKIPMKEVLTTMLSSFESDEVYDFHIGSYFLAFRQPVMKQGGELESLLNGVKKEHTKKDIILNYEIGLTRRLLQAGHRPATYIDYLYPLHPIYTNYYFDLVREGFPLFKRYLLTENHYKVEDLYQWKQRIEEYIPDVNLKAAERNLQRVANADKLHHNLHISSSKLLSNAQFIKEDKVVPKDDFCWAFPVCGFDSLFSGNERIIFEAVKNNPNVRKIILYPVSTSWTN